MGAELEGPFGIDANDFSLLGMGLDLSRDLDGLLRSLSRKRILARIDFSDKEQAKARAASGPLDWRRL